jgi:chromosome segregation ATPase
MAQHKKSKMHLAWEASKEVKDVRIQSKQFENEIERLKRRLAHKEDIEVELLNRIHQLEGDVQYWKAACEGVYVN